jgi:hypothetical protein
MRGTARRGRNGEGNAQRTTEGVKGRLWPVDQCGDDNARSLETNKQTQRRWLRHVAVRARRRGTPGRAIARADTDDPCWHWEYLGHCWHWEYLGHCWYWEYLGHCWYWEYLGHCWHWEYLGHCWYWEYLGHFWYCEYLGQRLRAL